jgi:hypothetical protein
VSLSGEIKDPGFKKNAMVSMLNAQKVPFEDLLNEIEQFKSNGIDDENMLHNLFEACVIFLGRRLKRKKKGDMERVYQLLKAVNMLCANGDNEVCIFKNNIQRLKLAKLANKNFGIEMKRENGNEMRNHNIDNEDEDDDDDGESLEEKSKGISKWLKSEKDDTTGLNNSSCMAQQADKYVLYQQSVQSAKADIFLFEKIFKEHYSLEKATVFREDFCGTAWLCTEWIKRNKVENIAVGIDLDSEPIEWGLKNNVSALNSAADSVFLFKENVLTFDWDASLLNESKKHKHLLERHADNDKKRIKKAHIVCAYNYSICLLHERSQLAQYFSRVRESMNPKNSIFLLDILGGSKLSSIQERTRKEPNNQFIYLFEQEGYNPCTDIAEFSIHFKFNSDQSTLRKAFSFRFRKWGIREVVECLKEVGFSQVIIYWCNHSGNELEFKRLSAIEQQKLQQSEQWTALLCSLY